MIATAVRRQVHSKKRVCASKPKSESALDAVSDATLAQMSKTASLDGVRGYVIEDDLTEEEIASIDECLQEYKEYPETFVSLETVIQNCRL